MTKILGISGSLRAGSYNSMLVRAAAQLAAPAAEVEFASIRGIPLYDGDLEASEGIPQAVRDLKDRILACDGLLLATPEYNSGIPGAFKNAIDWLSRPPSDIPRVFGNRPVAIMGTSPGAFGTALAQNDWLPVLRTLGTRPWFGGRLVVPRAHQVFNEAGEMVDAAATARLRDFVQGFARFVRANQAEAADA